MHEERSNKHADDEKVPDGAVPAYLLDREGVSRAKVLFSFRHPPASHYSSPAA